MYNKLIWIKKEKRSCKNTILDHSAVCQFGLQMLGKCFKIVLIYQKFSGGLHPYFAPRSLPEFIRRRFAPPRSLSHIGLGSLRSPPHGLKVWRRPWVYTVVFSYCAQVTVYCIIEPAVSCVWYNGTILTVWVTTLHWGRVVALFYCV